MATPEEMDLAAPDAENDLTESLIEHTHLDPDHEAIQLIANWWANWVGKVGHKRLGRILLHYRD